MKNVNISKFVKLGFVGVMIILAIISFFLLPDKVAMQFSASGQLQNYIPKEFAVIIPFGVYALTFLPNKNGENEDVKRNLIISIVALFVQVVTLVVNL